MKRLVPRGRRSISWRDGAAGLLVAVLAFAATACGGPSEQELAEARSEQLNKLTPTLQSRLQAQAESQKTACENELGDFLEAVDEIDSRLSVGMNYSDYSGKTADAKVAYDRVDAGELTQRACVNAALAGEQALRSYIAAYTIWNDCFDSDYCSNDSITPELQAKWAQATRKNQKAQELLDSVGKAGVIGNRDFPRSVGEVDGTIYGTIASAVCATPDPPAARAPCEELRNLIAGGVTEDEEGDVDGRIDELVDALGLNPS
jgi:hypothetical protein